MASDDETEDERPGAGGPLPPDDRLWRHPSEIAGGTPPPAAWGSTAPPPTTRRSTAVLAVVGASIAGAALAATALWLGQPTKVVLDHEAPTTAVPVTSAGFLPTPAAGTRAAELAESLTVLWSERSGEWHDTTAVWLTDTGDLAVAASAVVGADRLLVTAAGGGRGEALLVGIDDATGIATVRVSGPSGSHLRRSSQDPVAGQEVTVVSASGPDVITTTVRSVGQRSAVDQVVLHDTIELDRSVPAELVGSLVVAANGRIVGIVVAGSGPGGRAVVTPAADALRAAIDLRDDGKVRRARLGVEVTDLDPADAVRMQVDGGAEVTEVTADSPAALAGIAPGDVVVAVGETEVLDASNLVVAVRDLSPGTTVELRWVHGGAEKQAQVPLGG